MLHVWKPGFQDQCARYGWGRDLAGATLAGEDRHWGDWWLYGGGDLAAAGGVKANLRPI